MAKAAVKQTGGSVNFGDDAFYSAGFTLAEGDYLWRELNVVMHEGFGEKKLAPRLGVMITLSPLSDPAQESKHFWSMGGKAHLSFVPSEDGKGLEAVAGGPASTANAGTNWNMLRKSLIDCGMPADILKNDVSVLEGLWAHMASVSEPAERASFAQDTSETGETRKPGLVAIVTGIVDGGAPWDGGGGEPEVTAKKPAARPALKPVAAKTTVKAAPADDDEEVKAAAVNAIASILSDQPKGCAKMVLRVGTFKAVKASEGNEMAQKVQKLFDDDEALTSLLSDLDFQMVGNMVKPV